MGFKFRVIFNGLCIFVPNIPDQQKKQAMQVLLVNGANPPDASNKQPQLSHVPHLIFNLTDVYSRSTRIDSPNPTDLKGLWRLEGDDLEFCFNGKGVTDEILTIEDKFSELITHMKDLYPQGLEVKDECFNTNINPKDLDLAARLQLKGGTITAKEDPTGEPPVIFETYTRADKVDIVSKSTNTRITLKPADGQIVEIKIRNEPPEEVFSYIRKTNPKFNFDMDFELVYLVAKKKPEVLKIPRPKNLAFSTGSPGSKCGTVVYNPSSLF